MTTSFIYFSLFTSSVFSSVFIVKTNTGYFLNIYIILNGNLLYFVQK